MCVYALQPQKAARLAAFYKARAAEEERERAAAEAAGKEQEKEAAPGPEQR